tara:strand:- start:79 stop:501 length:423 start_codon:yes stop_codon:yes gene_type:complete
MKQRENTMNKTMTVKELAEIKKQIVAMGWNDKIAELDKSIESGELMIVETKERQKHIHFCIDSENVEQYRVSESEVAKLTSFNYEPTSYNKSETKAMALLSDKVVRVERRVKEFTINAKSVTVYFDKDGNKLEVPKEGEK